MIFQYPSATQPTHSACLFFSACVENKSRNIRSGTKEHQRLANTRWNYDFAGRNKMLKFTIRDLFWLGLCVSICCAWYVDRADGPPPKIIPDAWRKPMVQMRPGIEDPRPAR